MFSVVFLDKFLRFVNSEFRRLFYLDIYQSIGKFLENFLFSQ